MRTLTIGFLAATALGCLSTAQAADLDYDYLRGPEYDPAPTQIVDWSGFYVGGHGGYTSTSFTGKNIYSPLVAKIVRNTVDESEYNLSRWLRPDATRAQATSFGAIAGYNYQVDDVVLGFEADYTHGAMRGLSSNSMSRYYVTSTGLNTNTTVSGSTRTDLDDYGTIRVRAGYAIGSFLPFVTGGIALGRATIADSALVSSYGYDKTTADANAVNGTNLTVRTSRTYDTKTNEGERFAFGFTLGGGLEFAVTQNILLRAEYQYIQFDSFNGHKLNLNTMRGGVAYKF